MSNKFQDDAVLVYLCFAQIFSSFSVVIFTDSTLTIYNFKISTCFQNNRVVFIKNNENLIFGFTITVLEERKKKKDRDVFALLSAQSRRQRTLFHPPQILTT